MSQTKSNFKKSTQQKGDIRDQCDEAVRMGVVSKRPKKSGSGRLWDLSFLAIFGQKSSFASRYFDFFWKMKNRRQRGHTNACGGLEILPLGMGIGYKFRKPNQFFLKMAPAGPFLNPIKFQNLTFLRVDGVPPVGEKTVNRIFLTFLPVIRFQIFLDL